MARKILFVCLGNICRSPAAEGLVRGLCPDLETDSCGTSNWHEGEPPYGPMQAAAQARGTDLSDLRARQFSVQDFERFDLILAMDRDNLAEIEALRPAGAAGQVAQVRLFAPYAGWAGTAEVPDPYYTRDFDGCLDLLTAAAKGLRDALQAS